MLQISKTMAGPALTGREPEEPGSETAAGVSVTASAAASAAAVRRRRRAWINRYLAASAALDVCAFLIAAAAAMPIRYSGGSLPVGALRVPYALGAMVGAVLYLGAMFSAGAYDRRVLGHGPDEYRRVLNGGVRFIAAFALLEVAFRMQVGRSVLLATVPGAILLSVAGHNLARRSLGRARARGRHREHLVVVGRDLKARAFIRHLDTWGAQGMEMKALYTGSEFAPAGLPEDAVWIRDRDTFFTLARSGQIDTVAVVDRAALGDQGLRDLGWALEGLGVDIMLAPEATDVAGPRLAVRPVAGLPLVHVEEPRFGGPGRWVQDVVERAVAAAGLLALLPVFLVVGLAVRLDSPGPVFFRQTRVGRSGKQFTLYKFRSMTADAEATRDQVIHLNDHDGVLFKVRLDPRVTRVGRWLRRYSIDELPQLWNVVRGDMAIVGPRPPLPAETVQYPGHVWRRLLVKPGLTGLWQVNGRSNLSWEDSIRLDLHYVDNRSPTGDLAILMRTLGVVLRGDGAY